ncbi:MAG TPA: hypothetical protein PLU58_00610 [Saprospiraceae bacterium]|nr:hypothetical protein [Saprospiraceae bacterium]
MPIIYRFMWNNREVFIKYKPKTFDAYERIYGTPLSHIAIECEQPLPISDTGFKSYYIANSALLEYGGPLEFVKDWLNEEAEKPAWKAFDAKHRQLSLF